MTVTQSGKVSSGKLQSLAIAGLDRGLILSAQLVAQRATQRSPIDTGRLKRSIKAGRPYNRPGNRRAINVGTNVVYAAIQEFGGKTKPHVISPRTKAALAFKWPNAPSGMKPGKSGLFVFKHINHPGSVIPAQPYLRPALAASQPDIANIINKSVVGAINS